MKGIQLQPAQDLLANFTYAELARMARRNRLGTEIPRARLALINLITRHLGLDDIVEAIPGLFPRPKRVTVGSLPRLDQLPPLHGAATVQVYSSTRPALGTLLIEHGTSCRGLALGNAPLFLENRWPVIARDSGRLPHARLYAAFVRPGRIHSAAEAAPPRTRPFMLDEGEYQLRNSRLRLELKRSGPLSFLLSFLRLKPGANRAEYLFAPIA
jgi:hypothetical protein